MNLFWTASLGLAAMLWSAPVHALEVDLPCKEAATASRSPALAACGPGSLTACQAFKKTILDNLSEHAEQRKSIAGAAVEEVADSEQAGPDDDTSGDPADHRHGDVVFSGVAGGFGVRDSGFTLDPTPTGSEGAHLLIELNEDGALRVRAE